MSTATSPTLYDEFRYPGKFYPQASPERMAMLATLYGLKPPPVERSRVLEVGCGEGGHLIPVAYALKDSHCVGVDLSQASIERARETAARLGVVNAEFRALDLMQFPANAGAFDYIVAHGLFSWIPPGVQDKLLEICSRHLAPNGVAYVSYNTYPAGHLRQITRDLMRFHTRHITDPATKLREAKKIVDFVISAIPEPTVERELLRREAAVHKKSDPLLFFDALAEVNEPLYFLDFMEQAAAYGLQFVAESDIHRMRTARLPEHARAELEAVPDRLLREQYLDFIHCRGFRQTILCRAGHDLDLNVIPERMERLMIASSTQPAVPVRDITGPETVEFRTAQGQTVNTNEAIPKAVYLELGDAWPRAVPYADLRARICRRAGLESLALAAEARLIRMLVSSLANAVAEFRAYQAPLCTAISERPLAGVVARWQAEAGLPVTSLLLNSFQMPEPELRRLLPLLDGTRDHPELLAELRQADPRITAEFLHKSLARLAECAMLLA
ncbi:MAG TPA: class I SAM-dependent methyltransferase [Terriglobales bacterium]|nr:class I SAM-dependent methyltransferase [Terriglobales bacterium]